MSALLPPEVQSSSGILLEDIFNLENPDLELVVVLAYPGVGEVDRAQGQRREGGGGGGGGAAVQRGVQPPHSLLPGPPVQLPVISSTNNLSIIHNVRPLTFD